MDYPKKLIEVALPLDDINAASAREKSIRHGHPSTLHLWWARRPLAAARAVLFAQLVNDPGGQRGWGAKRGQTKEDAQREREKLFDILRDLVKWENTNNEAVLEKARAEIRRSWEETCKLTGDNPENLPAFHDPFAGGGAIPLEAQRLGLEAHASDLNPVAVLINKAMIEIPPKFANRPPIHPDQDKETVGRDWRGAEGLAEDVRYYGQWMRDEAFRRVGHLYPKAELPKELGGGEALVIAWIWARTVESPNPAYKGCHVPLVSNFFLSTRKGQQVWIDPVVTGREYRFEIRTGTPRSPTETRTGTKLGRGASFRCLLSGVPIAADYIKAEGKAGRMGQRMLAVATQGRKGRVFLPATEEMENLASQASPLWNPDQKLNNDPRAIWTPAYGLETYADLFTARQLLALTTFTELCSEVAERVSVDARATGMVDDGQSLQNGGASVSAYGDAVACYLALAISRSTDYWSSICTWRSDPKNLGVGHVFSRQGIPMTWDFAEGNPFSDSSGNWTLNLSWIVKVLGRLDPHRPGSCVQASASDVDMGIAPVISTDPPYYDNIGYADLSDFFYVWLRKALRPILPELFATIAVPKGEELVASPYRHGGKAEAEEFFLSGMTAVMNRLAAESRAGLPITIYYAFKQSETKNELTASTGWETFLEAVLASGLWVTGTWPMRTEMGNRQIGMVANALASSVVLVCRKRPEDSGSVSRKQFLRELNEALPDALEDMIGGTEGASPIAPVDLAQAAIGPGMAVFSQYTAVLEADGSAMSVHTALTLINKAIDEYFTHAESDMDADTRFCVDWFQQYGFKAGAFGEADVLARAKGTSVEGVCDAGVLESGSGKVRLFRAEEYDVDWDPQADRRVPVWEACHQMARALQAGEADAGTLLAEMPDKTERIRQLAYRLYTVCERKGWAKEAGVYNALIASWREVVAASHDVARATPTQQELL